MNDMCMMHGVLKYTISRATTQASVRSLSGAWVILVTHCHQKCAFLVAVCHARGCTRVWWVAWAESPIQI